MNHSSPGLPVHHQLPESTQTHAHWFGDAKLRAYIMESAALNMSAILENSAVAIGLEKVSFHSNPKERQC